eukprot:767976-Hanusia_phi.AAC.3
MLLLPPQYLLSPSSPSSSGSQHQRQALHVPLRGPPRPATSSPRSLLLVVSSPALKTQMSSRGMKLNVNTCKEHSASSPPSHLLQLASITSRNLLPPQACPLAPSPAGNILPHLLTPPSPLPSPPPTSSSPSPCLFSSTSPLLPPFLTSGAFETILRDAGVLAACERGAMSRRGGKADGAGGDTRREGEASKK